MQPAVWQKFRQWYYNWDHDKHSPLYAPTVLTSYAIKQSLEGRQPLRNMPELWTTQFTEDLGGMSPGAEVGKSVLSVDSVAVSRSFLRAAAVGSGV